MADLTANAPLRIKGEIYTQKRKIDTAAARTIYKGQPMIIDQSVDATGNVVQFVDAVVVDPTDVFVGIAAEGKSVASGASETTELEMYVEPTIVGFKSAVYTDGADLGKTVYMSDSGTLSATAADNPQIGKLHSVEDGYAFVQLASPQICAGA
jgi:hypothetical protein